MAEYQFREIEKKWQKHWKDEQTFKTAEDRSRPKFYSLDMFPYPSGAGLHVGHPLGYIASDIISRYKRLQGFNVLHPMGFDAFGLPAEQYAIQTGQHPAVTTEKNIQQYKKQLENIGFSFDWSREVQTCDPNYYKWTQWIFCQLYKHWYDLREQKARPVSELELYFQQNGNAGINAACDEDTPLFSSKEWKNFSEKEKSDILLKYRLTYLSEATVNWCPALGTVLSNDEVKDGFSERGGHPVERKKMKQWSQRITAYAERLLSGLEHIDWPEPIKEMQRNWIGKSVGAEIEFGLEHSDKRIKVFTTRIDTIFGVSFMVLAPEHELVKEITTHEQRKEVEQYVEVATNRSERDRMADTKKITGVFTGAYAIHPFSKEKLPVWIADYVLAGYGTGAVMAVPCGDQRDYDFAKHFHLPIPVIIEGIDISEQADPTKEGTIVNSGFLNGLSCREAKEKAIAKVEEMGIGSAKVNYKMRDAIFSRQRYWGEPVPVYFKNDIPVLLGEDKLPLILPEVDEYKPTEEGDPPLGRAKDWRYKGEFPYELTTMPGWAGSSWYFFRYMDPTNDAEFCNKEVQDYWKNVDLYIGGSEHATGHLLYARFWTKFLFDIGKVGVDEPFQKLINQGMIQGVSNFVYRLKNANTFVSFGLRNDYETVPMHVDISLVQNNELDIEGFKKWRTDLHSAEFILENGIFKCGAEVEKMSKSKHNVVNPDDIIEQYGADTLRLYEMFLGPLEQSKPWNTNGIDGVHRFLKKFWGLFFDDKGQFSLTDDEASPEAKKVVNKTIKKVKEDIERYAFNTPVSEFMICTNKLRELNCRNRELLEKLVILLSPYAPHISEELWARLGHSEGISNAAFPTYDEQYIRDDSYEYPVSINGKMRTKMNFPVDTPRGDIERQVLENEVVRKWTEGKPPKKVIVIPQKIVNVVV